MASSKSANGITATAGPHSFSQEMRISGLDHDGRLVDGALAPAAGEEAGAAGPTFTVSSSWLPAR